MGRLEGKVALISGGARGQGATEARLFAQEGARVVLGDLLDAAGQQVEEEIRAQGGEATYVHLDVTSEAEWVEAVGTAVNRYGKFAYPLMVRRRPARRPRVGARGCPGRRRQPPPPPSGRSVGWWPSSGTSLAIAAAPEP